MAPDQNQEAKDPTKGDDLDGNQPESTKEDDLQHANEIVGENTGDAPVNTENTEENKATAASTVSEGEMENPQKGLESTKTSAPTLDLSPSKPQEDLAKTTEPVDEFVNWGLEKLTTELERIVNLTDSGTFYKRINDLKEAFTKRLEQETNERKAAYLKEGGDEEAFEFEPRVKSRFNALLGIFKEKYEEFRKKQEAEQAENLKKRQEIIERLKDLYTNTKPNIDLFKEIRKIKEQWRDAGFVARAEYKTMLNDYHFHLERFYEMLDLNKEYREQEYRHNLELRKSIIEHVKLLIKEPVVRKALNDLQYLHKLWKDEAVPVAEEFRESTWQEFKELSNVVLDRKKELYEQLETEHQTNLKRKTEIIAEIKKFTEVKNATHSYWQNAVKQVENLRAEFISVGRVPKLDSARVWGEFKEALRNFNAQKNGFYKEQKKEQQDNLQRKLELIRIAHDNKESEDWETTLQLFKNIQKEWRSVGHVARNQADKIWAEFQADCNYFFERYRAKTGSEEGDNWEENFKKKKQLLDQLEKIGSATGAVDKINEIKNQWNAIGKVPRSKMDINRRFNKALKAGMTANSMSLYDLKDDHLSAPRRTDKARLVKKQIEDLEGEIANLENNLAFFKEPNRENPLLKDTYHKLDAKKTDLEQMKETLHQIIEEHNRKEGETPSETIPQ